MALELITEKGTGVVSVVTIGATKASGGTRGSVVSIGGQKALPFLFKDGEIPHKPVIAYEIWDVAPTDWSDDLRDVFEVVVQVSQQRRNTSGRQKHHVDITLLQLPSDVGRVVMR